MSLRISNQVPAEFLHIVTDPRRFEHPLSMEGAIARKHRWWHAREVQVVPAGEAVGSRFLELLRAHHLGRGNLLDTLLTATCLEAGVHVIATVNAGDFARFEGVGTVLV